MSGPRTQLRALGGLLLAVALVSLPVPALAQPTGPDPSVPAARSAPVNTWHEAGRLGLGYGRMTSCPTTSSCWALSGGELLSSQDGGMSWQAQSDRVPAEVELLDALDCPSAASCYLTGRRKDLSSTVLAMTATEVHMVGLPTAGPLRTISCATEFRCLTTDGTIVFRTHDHGVTWQQQSQHLTGFGLAAVSCVPSSTRCWVVGGSIQAPRIAMTTNNGASWHPQSAPHEYSPLRGVDCPTIDACYAVGQDTFDATLIATSDGGATWARQTLPSGTDPLTSISCPSVQACWAAGGPSGLAFGAPVVVATTDAGAHWAAQYLGSFPVGASEGALTVSCPSSSVCAGVTSGGLGFFTTSGGATWTAVAVPAALGEVARLSCPTRHRCVGMSSDQLLRRVSLTSTDGGTTWSRHALPAGAGYVTSLDCPSASVCYATAFVHVTNRPRLLGQVLSSADGGATWRLDRSDDVKPLGFGTLSCSTVTTCLAVGQDKDGPIVRSTTDGAATWQPVAPPAGVSRVDDVACASSCVVLATPADDYHTNLAFTTTDLGASYQPRDLPAADYGYNGVDCFDATCIAVGNNADWHGAIAGSADNGATWAAQRVPPGATRLQDVSCGSTTACAVTGNNDNGTGDGGEILGTRNAGRNWSVFTIPLTNVSWPLDIACAGAACLASDYGVSGTPRILAGPGLTA